ncbi:MAG TPA: tetratricopeptide repeat protein [Candidatus Limnocylindria bacterium]|nr:tetratricopeptide repeat protein [Candidatus Limnocylindria bacterium]
MTGVLIAALVIGVPAVVFTVWPLLRRGGRTTAFLPLPADGREQLLERKRAALRTLRELQFEHDSGHVSDADYADLRARYEGETAAILTDLDQLGPVPAPAPAAAPVAAAAGSRRGWRHPLAIGASAVALVVFGVTLGVGIVRYTEPDPMAGVPPVGSRPLASLAPAAPDGDAPSAANAPRGPVTPEMLAGMLGAARASLFDGRYSEAIAAYQAVLKREPKNVDAITHLGLIVAIGGHADSALETFERALAIDPDYPPALLYRGQVLLETRKDTAGAIRSWEHFLKVTPPGEDHDRVARMIADARRSSP